MLLIAITDRNDKIKDIDFKLRKIRSFFLNKYRNILVNFNGDTSLFQDFKQFLLDKKVLDKNCGKRVECSVCSNSSNTSASINKYENNVANFLESLSRNL